MVVVARPAPARTFDLDHDVVGPRRLGPVDLLDRQRLARIVRLLVESRGEHDNRYHICLKKDGRRRNRPGNEL